jgi:hypothetical protein
MKFQRLLRSSITPFVLIAALVAALPVPIRAQTTVNATTLSAAVTSLSNQRIPLTSVSTVSVGDILFIDREAMLVQAVDTSALIATVTRGYQGTKAAAHANTSVVWTGPPRRFYTTDVVGTCTATAELFLPHITLPGGNIYQCSNSEWVRWVDVGFRAFEPGRTDGGTTYTASGAITIQPGVSFLGCAGVCAMTLANPTQQQNGLLMIFSASTAQAHTVTTASNKINSNKSIGTFTAAIGNSFALIAVNGVWWAVSLNGVALT